MAAPAQELSPSGSEVYNHNLYATHDLGQSALRLVNSNIELSHGYTNSLIESARQWGLVPPFADDIQRILKANQEISARLAADYPKPEFGLNDTIINGEAVGVKEVIVDDKAFGALLNFERDTDRNDPPVLLIAPMSGHYASLLRDTVRHLLPSHDVYITDWKNARDVPVEEGDFSLDDYISYVEDFIKKMGPDTNVIAVCQATVPALAAVSHIAKTDPEGQPATLTLMAGPLDPAAAPTEVTKFADRTSLEWIQRYMIGKVPKGYAGEGRDVYPGFLQGAAFVSMNPQNHIDSHRRLYSYYIDGDNNTASREAARKIELFYNDYWAFMDMAARYFLDTNGRVFMEPELPNGTMMYNGSLIEPGAITRTAVKTVEGANDAISAPGQTVAVHSWLTGLPPEMKYHHLQEGAGHYGNFSGKKYAAEIAPRITEFIRRKSDTEYDPPASPVIIPSQYRP
jgi:poly(3-hydroxybutyrate) depolymerase